MRRASSKYCYKLPIIRKFFAKILTDQYQFLNTNILNILSRPNLKKMASFHIVHIQRKHFHPISFPTNQSKIKPNIEKGSHDKSARTPNRKGQNDRFTVKNRNLDATWSCRTCPSDGSPLASRISRDLLRFERRVRDRPVNHRRNWLLTSG